MKLQDYLRIETTLGSVLGSLNEMYESIDTSKHLESESDLEINEWNIKLNDVMNYINELNQELIFTFKIEEEPAK